VLLLSSEQRYQAAAAAAAAEASAGVARPHERTPAGLTDNPPWHAPLTRAPRRCTLHQRARFRRAGRRLRRKTTQRLTLFFFFP